MSETIKNAYIDLEDEEGWRKALKGEGTKESDLTDQEIDLILSKAKDTQEREKLIQKMLKEQDPSRLRGLTRMQARNLGYDEGYQAALDAMEQAEKKKDKD